MFSIISLVGFRGNSSNPVSQNIHTEVWIPCPDSKTSEKTDWSWTLSFILTRYTPGQEFIFVRINHKRALSRDGQHKPYFITLWIFTQHFYTSSHLNALLTSQKSQSSEKRQIWLVECPLVLTPDLLLLLWREIILDIESLSNLLWRLALDHLRHCLARQIEKPFDIQVVRSLHPQQHLSWTLTQTQGKAEDFVIWIQLYPEAPTKIRSNSVDWSTLTNSASHALMSSSLFAGLSSTFLFASTWNFEYSITWFESTVQQGLLQGWSHQRQSNHRAV